MFFFFNDYTFKWSYNKLHSHIYTQQKTKVRIAEFHHVKQSDA